jgi:hypothetical protein
MTIGFSICNTIFIYSPSVNPGWHSLLLPPNFTVASVLACRLFRELKLGLFADPLTEPTISNVVFRDIRTPEQQSRHAFELCTLDNAGVDIGSGRTRGDLGDEN